MNRTQQIAVLLISEYFLTVSGRSTAETLTLCQPFINSAYLASDSHSQGTAIWHAHVTSQRVICLFKLASLCILRTYHLLLPPLWFKHILQQHKMSDYGNPLAGYENAEPLPDTINPDGKSLYNPPGPLSKAYEEFPDPLDKNNNGFDFHSTSLSYATRFSIAS